MATVTGPCPSARSGLRARLAFVRSGLLWAVRGGPFAALSGLLWSEALWSSVAGHVAVVRSRQALLDHYAAHSLPSDFRYLRPHLSRAFTPVTRRLCITHHQQTLAAFLRGVAATGFPGRLTVWERAATGGACTIAFDSVRRTSFEGEMQLSLLLGGQTVYRLAFTVVPDGVLGPRSCRAILIGQIQGEPARLEQIKLCSRICDGVGPVPLLMTALEAIGERLGVSHVYGIGGRHQLSEATGTVRFLFDYDRFWSRLGFTADGDGYFRSPLPMARRPSAGLSRPHQRRAARRRHFRDGVAAVVTSAIGAAAGTSTRVAGAGDRSGSSPTATEAMVVRGEPRL